MLFSRVKFILSAARKEQFPKTNFPEFAVLGRSNVGKSSFLNHLLGGTPIARVSRTPGKTQQINFFVIDEELSWADLPGYGFAAVPPAIRDQWGKLVDSYLTTRENLRAVILLHDSRYPPTDEDEALLGWIIEKQIPFFALLTKADRAGQELERLSLEKRYQRFSPQYALGAAIPGCCSLLTYSIKNASFRRNFINQLNSFLAS